MRNAIHLLCGALVTLLAGCAAVTYYHPAKTQADFTRDSYDCEKDAYQRTADMGFPGNPMIVRDEYHACMTRKYGYTTAPSGSQP